MFRTCLLFAICSAPLLASAAPLLPTADGTRWEYNVTASDAGSAPVSKMTVEIQGKEEIKGKWLLRFETLADGDLAKSELLSVDERGLLCHERTLAAGKTTPFNPPLLLLPATLKLGAKWEMDDSLGGTETRRQFNVAAEENVVVPAGAFRAFRLHCEEPWPMSIAIDRWFVPGTGFVKDVTETRGPGGRLMNRATMELAKLTIPTTPSPPRLPARPSVEVLNTPPPAASPSATASPSGPMKIKLEVAKARDGQPVTEFKSDAPEIFVRWSGENLPANSEVRVAWIAEDVGEVAPPNFVVDETRSVISNPIFGARFTLSRPKDGWAAGKYRVELYLEDELQEKVSVTIRE